MAPPGSYAIGWDQVTLDGVAGAEMSACRAGTAWRWTGRVVRLDGPPGVLRLGESADTADLRRRARRGAAWIMPLPAAVEADDPTLDGPAITVTDGRRSWRVDLLPARRGLRALAHFPAVPPPAGTDLWITRVDGAEGLDHATQGDEVWHGLAAGTLVATPEGARPAGQIRPGMTVLTPAGRAEPVLWTGQRAVSGARLCVTPALAPVRIAAGALGAGLPGTTLWLAPDQGVLLDGPRVRALWPQGPVVAAARDLVDGAGITRASGLPGMVAHVILPARAGAILASGLALEAMPPDGPGDPAAQAPVPRRLSRGEAAILRAVPA